MTTKKDEYTLCDLGRLESMKVVCLTLDVEQDYGARLAEPSYEGLEHIPDLVDLFKKRNIPLTCFVQGSLLETYPDKIVQLSSLDVEFELHTYSHPDPKRNDIEFEIRKGKEAYRKLFGKDPIGYRAPLGVINDDDYRVLAWQGFKFDSSIFPSIRPGVFNNLKKPLKPYFLNGTGIIEFPITVLSKLFRIPMSLSYLNLLGKLYLQLIENYKLPGFIIFNFHLHDLLKLDSANKIPIKTFSLPYRLVFNRIYQRDENNGLKILDQLINTFSNKGYTFSKLVDIHNLIINPDVKTSRLETRVKQVK